MKLRKLILLTALGSFAGCASEEPKKKYIHASQFSYIGPRECLQKAIDEQVFPEERHLIKIQQPTPPNLEGFKVSQLVENFPVEFHNVFKARTLDTGEEFYTGRTGA